MKDIFNVTLFLRIWGTSFCFLSLPFVFFTGFSRILLFTAGVALVLAVPLYFFISYSGNLFGDLFYGTGQRIPKKEQLQGDLLKARSLMAQEKYQIAVQTIEHVLEQEPTWADALFIRAQLARRMGDPGMEHHFLRQILRECPKGETARKWAVERLRDIQNGDGEPIGSD